MSYMISPYAVLRVKNHVASAEKASAVSKRTAQEILGVKSNFHNESLLTAYQRPGYHNRQARNRRIAAYPQEADKHQAKNRQRFQYSPDTQNYKISRAHLITECHTGL